MIEGDKRLGHIRFTHREFTLSLVVITFVLLLFFIILIALFETPMSSFVFGSGALATCFILIYYLFTRKILNSVKLIMLSSYCVIIGNSYSFGGIFSPSIWWFAAYAVYVGIFFGKKTSKVLAGVLFLTLISIYAAHKFNLFPEPELVGAGKEELFFLSSVLLLIITIFFNKLNSANFSGLLLRTKNSEKQAYISANMASLGEMASSIAHEINNPLTIIKGNLQQLKKELGKIDNTSVNIDKKLDNMSKAIDRAASIVTSLRSVSSSDLSVGRGFSTLDEVFRHITNLMNQKLEEGLIDFEVDISDQIRKAQISLSPVLLSQVFLSLISNSIEAILSLDKRWIKITAELQSDSLLVSVVDSGHGIDQNVQDKMFNPLFSTKETGRGTGLGLSISRSMLEKSSAELFYKDLEGRTCFCLNLPIV